jgi:hypothetical protein
MDYLLDQAHAPPNRIYTPVMTKVLHLYPFLKPILIGRFTIRDHVFYPCYATLGHHTHTSAPMQTSHSRPYTSQMELYPFSVVGGHPELCLRGLILWLGRWTSQY